MKVVYHKDLADGRWERMTLMEQLANIGSEVGRFFSSKQLEKEQRAQIALERALELFDMTLADSKNRQRYKEIARAREMFAGNMYNNGDFSKEALFWQKYFFAFTVRSRKK